MWRTGSGPGRVLSHPNLPELRNSWFILAVHSSFRRFMTQKDKSNSDQPRQETSATSQHLLHARDLFHAGDHAGALDVCATTLSAGERALDVGEAALVCEILDGCGEKGAAEQLRQRILASALQHVEENPDSEWAQSEAGFMLLESGAEREAEPYLHRALEIRPDNPSPAFMLLRILLRRGKPEEAIAAWEPFIAATKRPGAALLSLAKGLGHFGFQEHAEGILKLAEEQHAVHAPPRVAAAAGTKK